MNIKPNMLSNFARIFPFIVLSLIFVGALVTSHDAGLAVPDWPSTFGENMFLFPLSKWRGGIFFEHGHRIYASIIGFLTVFLFLWTLIKEERKWLKVLTSCALIAVIMQGILGGLTVKFQLPVQISSAHAVLAQTFLLIIVGIAFAHTDKKNIQFKNKKKHLYFFATLVILVYIQLIIGAIMRHSGSGLAITDFPSMGGAFLPKSFSPNFDEWILQINADRIYLGLSSVTSFQILIHCAHRILGIIIFLTTIFFFFLSEKQGKKFLLSCLILLTAQVALGIGVIILKRPAIFTSFHVLLGAILLSVFFWNFLRICYYKNNYSS